MNKRSNIRKISLLILTLLLILGSSISVFAGSKSGGDPTVGSLQQLNSDIYSGNVNYAGGALYIEKYNSFILAVYTGYESGESCYKIAVTYSTNDTQANGKNVEITQVLDVQDCKVTDNVTAVSSLDDKYFRNGSRYNTYVRLWNDNSTETEADGRYYDDTVSSHRADSLYEYWITLLSGQDNTDNIAKYITQNQINNTQDTMFQAYSTEYIRFQPEYAVKDIVKVEFYMSGSGVEQWSLLGWDMYYVMEWSSFNGDSTEYAGPSIPYNIGDNIKSNFYYGYVGPEMTSYSYFSDRLALVLNTDYNNILHVAQGAYDKNRVVGIDHTQGMASFVSPLANYYTSYLINPNSSSGELLDNTFEITNDKSDYQASPKTLNFEIKFSDEYGSGINSYFSSIEDSELELGNSTTNNNQRLFRDYLYARITYVNGQGFEEEVEVPVVSNALLEAVLGNDEFDFATSGNSTLSDVLTNNIASFCQDGQKLTFHVDFPDFKSIKSIKIKYVNDLDSTDTIQIHSITVYDDDCTGSRVDYYDKTISGSINTVVPSTCNAVYKNSEDDYEVYFENSLAYIYELVPASQSNEAVVSYENTYLVTFNTTDVPLAGTTDKVYAQFEYLSAQGGEKLTDEYDISEVCQNFYGYNPAVVSSSKDANGNDVYPTGDEYFTQTVQLRDGSAKEYTCIDGSYYYGMNQGGTISFYIKANDLTRFTGVKLRMEASSDVNPVDEWQLDSIRIQSVESIGDRQINQIDGGIKLANTTLYNYFTREVTGDMLISKDNVYLLIENNETQEYRFEDDGISGNVDSGRDLQDYYYSISYELATMNLDFGGVSKTYEIKVNVAGKRDDLTDDNAGSSNLFYFQLIFKNGKSAYVQANQQLEADGFRSGQTETFYIKTNEDYGDVTAINIIPDDVTDDSAKLDKLCIDSIEVIKQNSNGINVKYLISNVGWISPEYHDESNDDYISKGRAVRDMASSYSVSSSSYMLTLEFAISYDKYGTMQYSETDHNGDVTLTTKQTPQFEGTMTADITYINSNGELKTEKGINIIEKMNSYDGISPVTDDANDGRTISNVKWMFRENTTDRFTFNAEDISVLKSITLKGTALYDTQLSISGMSASIITSSGRRYITANNEYKYLYEEDPALLVDTVENRTFPETLYFPANQEISYVFNFDEDQGTIPSFDEDSSLTSMISRVPESINDTMNVFIYMKEGAVSPREAGQELVSNISYSSTSTGKTYLQKLTTYDETEKDGQIILSVTGLNATNMTTLTNFTIKANSSYANALIDHAVVQQVRNETMIKTYDVTFVGDDASSRLGVNMSISNDVDTSDETQIVQVQLTDDTTTKLLTSEKYDLAAAIYYTSTIGDSTTVYSSPYVFLTDSGVSSVQAGQICNFEFNEPNVNSIVGVKFVATNGLEVGTNRVNINSYITSGEDGIKELVNTYSADGDAEIDAEGYKYTVVSSNTSGSRTYKLAKFTFKTMDNAQLIDSKGNYPIRMVINYKDVNGLDKTEVIEDIRNVADKNSSFAAGGTVTISRLLKGIDILSSVKIEPYNDETSDLAMWNLESLTFSVENTSMEIESTIGVGKTIFEGTPKTIGTVSSVMKLAVYNDSKQTDYYNEDVTISLDGYGHISIIPEIIGSGEFSQYSYTIYSDLNDNGYAKIASGRAKDSGDSIDVDIQPNSEASTVQKYKIVVSSDYLTDLSYSVYVNVYGSADAENVAIAETAKMSVSLDYTLGDIKGSVTNNSNSIEHDYTAYDITLKTSTNNLYTNKKLTYNRYEKLGNGSYELVETKTVYGGDTISYSATRNSAVDQTKCIKFEFISLADSKLVSSLEVIQSAPKDDQLSISYNDGGNNVFTLTNGEKTITYGNSSDVTRTITTSLTGNKGTDQYKYEYYYDAGDGNGYRLINSKTISGSYSINVTKPANAYGQDQRYKIVLTAVGDSSITTTLTQIFKGSGSDTYPSVIAKFTYKIGFGLNKQTVYYVANEGLNLTLTSQGNNIMSVVYNNLGSDKNAECTVSYRSTETADYTLATLKSGVYKNMSYTGSSRSSNTFDVYFPDGNVAAKSVFTCSPQ